MPTYLVVMSRLVYETAHISVEADSAEEAADTAIADHEAEYFSPPSAGTPFREGITVVCVTEDK